MLITWKSKRNSLVSIFMAIGITIIVGSMLFWPQDTYQGARYGLELWATVLVPSLFPFFIIAELILNLGIVHMLGILLEPVMRPLFNLPGSTSFVVAMGFTSGFPMGAVLTRRLVEENHCTKEEGQRLVAFTNNSSPLFIIVAVAVGMFRNPQLGLILAIVHYSSNIILGIILGFTAPRSPNFESISTKKENRIIKSIKALIQAQRMRKPWGQLMGDAIRSGINNISLIGGFVIIYAVVIKLLHASHLFEYLVSFFTSILSFIHFNTIFSTSLATGFWELTLGLERASGITASLEDKAMAISLLLGWSGLSIQSQVLSVLAGSGISPVIYFWGRLFQGIFAAILCKILLVTTNLLPPSSTLPAFSPLPPRPITILDHISTSFLFIGKGFIIVLLLLFTSSIFIWLIRSILKLNWNK